MEEGERRLFKMGEATIQTSLECATEGIPFILTPVSPRAYQIYLEQFNCLTSDVVSSGGSNLMAFNTPEHLKIFDPNRFDDLAFTTISKTIKSATELDYRTVDLEKIKLISGETLSYNQIVAFAGDYYDTFKSLENDRNIQFVARNYQKIGVGSVGGFAKNVISPLLNEFVPGSLGKRFDEMLMGKYTIDYILYAYNNFVHFRIPIKCNEQPPKSPPESGKANAIQAYRNNHQYALDIAKYAGKSQAKTMRFDDLDLINLERAFAINAFGDHFLEDLFSTGHMRVPRHEIHYSLGKGENPLSNRKAGEAMHDDDNKSGLWVKCKCDCPGTEENHGQKFWECKEPWQGYGDSNLHRSDVHAIKVDTAIHISAYEVLDAYQEAKKGNNSTANYFHVLQHIPIPYPPGIGEHDIFKTDPWDPKYELIMKSVENPSGTFRIVLAWASNHEALKDNITEGNSFPKFIVDGQQVYKRSYEGEPWTNDYLPFEVLAMIELFDLPKLERTTLRRLGKDSNE